MENDQNRTNITMIIVLLAVILLIAIFVISNRISIKEENRKKQDDDNEIIGKDTKVDQVLYKSYEIGDQITLLDSSDWHVIKKTSQKEEDITLLKDIKLSTELKKEEVNDFLTTSYLKLLKDNLSALSTDIKEVRLLSLEDIKEMIGIDKVENETIIEKENLEWLIKEKTLIENISSNHLPLLICNQVEEEKGKICEGEEKEIWPVRPVITISKEYIKE